MKIRLLSYNIRRGSEAVHDFWKKGWPFLMTLRLIRMWNVVAVARTLMPQDVKRSFLCPVNQTLFIEQLANGSQRFTGQ